jgi:hypothetical protein
MKKTFRQIVESCKPAQRPQMEVVECLQEAMDQYPMLGEMEMKPEEKPMGEGMKKPMEEGYGEEDMDPADGLKSAFKAAMMQVLDDDSLDTVGKLAKLKLMLAVSDKASEAMSGGAAGAGAMADEEMDSKMEESYKAKISGLQEQLQRSNCRAMLTESQIEVSEVKIKALLPLKESERNELVKSWKSGNVSKTRPARTGSIMQESSGPTEYPKTSEDFRRALN